MDIVGSRISESLFSPIPVVLITLVKYTISVIFFLRYGITDSLIIAFISLGIPGKRINAFLSDSIKMPGADPAGFEKNFAPEGIFAISVILFGKLL